MQRIGQRRKLVACRPLAMWCCIWAFSPPSLRIITPCRHTFDYSIDCHSFAHRMFIGLASVVTMVYIIGFPSLMLVILLNNRDTLAGTPERQDSYTPERISIISRVQNSACNPRWLAAIKGDRKIFAKLVKPYAWVHITFCESLKLLTLADNARATPAKQSDVFLVRSRRIVRAPFLLSVTS